MLFFVDLFRIERKVQRHRSQLSRIQLRRAIAYIEENCLGNVRLKELAELTGLSQTYFSHAFKASTGMPPHRWQMQARVRKSLTEVAVATGFSDQAHFTRVFKKTVGMTPAVWMRNWHT